MTQQPNRRGFLKASVVSALASPLVISPEERHLLAAAPVSPAAAPADVPPCPSGRLGQTTVSRLICGGNLISGYAHSRDLIYVSRLLKAYFTDEKVMETWALCERYGVNTMILNPSDRRALELYRTYRRNGGRIQFIAQLDGKPDGMDRCIEEAVEAEAVAILLVGNLGDRWSREGEAGVAQIRDFVVKVQAHGVPAGVAGHEIRTAKVCEAAGIAPDFYMKTLHTDQYFSARRPDQTKDVIDNYAVDNYWCKDAQETIEFMASVRRPWLAYKVLAAGAIRPREGFRFAFQSGADFLVVGMFDFQIAEDVAAANEVLARLSGRTRPWVS